MHVRPTVVVAIFAAAAGAAVARLPIGGGSPTFAVASSSGSRPDTRRTEVDALASSTSDGSGGFGAATPGAPSSAARKTAIRGARAVVYVAGNVRRPGVYALPDDARVADALRAAGGPTSDADPVAVDLAARIEDGQEIAVPARGAADAASVPGNGDTTATPRARRHAKHRRRRKHAHRKPRAAAVDARANETVDVNAADAATLATLPGIGPGLAERIVAFRDLNGPFASADELLDVGGITASKLERLGSSVTFGASRASSPVVR